MVRWGVLAAGATVVAGAAFVTGAAESPKQPVGVPKEVRAVAVVGQKMGFFNMPRLMRNYERAKTGVTHLNDRKARMSANLVGMRAMYLEIQQALQKQPPAAGPDQRNERELTERGMILLARRIEDADREIGRLLNNQAAETIVELHDEVNAAVVELAREHNLTAVFAYPDAATAEEANSPHVKELRLKPPAAHPFYLDPAVDYTDELLQKLNAKFAAEK